MDSSERKVSDENRQTPSSQQHRSGGKEEDIPSAGETMSSAKVIMDAAVSKFRNAEGEAEGGSQFDKAKVAAAAAAVLAAARHYGKTDGTNYGTYVQKAQDYLNNYGDSSPNDSKPKPTPTPSSESSAPSSDSSAPSESEGMKYFKKAQQFLSK